MRSFSNQVVGMASVSLVLPTTHTQLQKAEHNLKKLKRQVCNLEKRHAKEQDADKKASLQFQLTKRSHMYNRLLFNVVGEQGLVNKLIAQQERENSKKEKLKAEMAMHIAALDKRKVEIQKHIDGKRNSVMPENTMPSRPRQRVEKGPNGQRTVRNIKEKVFQGSLKTCSVPNPKPIGLGRLVIPSKNNGEN